MVSIKNQISYEPLTGVFTRLTRSSNALPGQVIPTPHAEGYKRITVGGKTYLAHRLAFFLMTGSWPSEMIDHINQDRSDNRWANLREADRSQNAFNRKANKGSSTGIKGVSLHKASGKYVVQICHRYLGLYDNIELAELVSLEAQDKFQGEFANLA